MTIVILLRELIPTDRQTVFVFAIVIEIVHPLMSHWA